jgi:hypothetical protein
MRSGEFAPDEVVAKRNTSPFDERPKRRLMVVTFQGFAAFSVAALNFNRSERWLVRGRAEPEPTNVTSDELLAEFCDG